VDHVLGEHVDIGDRDSTHGTGWLAIPAAVGPARRSARDTAREKAFTVLGLDHSKEGDQWALQAATVTALGGLRVESAAHTAEKDARRPSWILVVILLRDRPVEEHYPFAAQGGIERSPDAPFADGFAPARCFAGE
jgi:hypothetical protein